MLIQTKQIDSISLANFVINTTSGSFSGILTSYVAASGYLGPHVMYITGGDQVVNGQKTFINPILVPGTGVTGAAAPFGAVLSLISGSLLSYSGFVAASYATTVGTNTFQGNNTFLLPVSVARPTQTGHAVTFFDLVYTSGVLTTGLSQSVPTNVVFTTGDQQVLGNKVFGLNVWTQPATNMSGVVVLSQIVSGVSGFLNSGYLFAGSGLIIGTFAQRIAGLSSAQAAVQYVGTSITNGGGYGMFRFSASAGGTTALIHKSRGASVGAHGGAIANDILYDENVSSSDGSTYVRAHRRYVSALTTITGGTGMSQVNYTCINSGGEATVFVMNSTQNQSVPPLQVAQPTNSTHATRLLDLTSASGAILTATAMSFYFDEFNLATGLNLIEGFVNQAFYITGVALGARVAGATAVLTGQIYRRDTSNTKSFLYGFTLGSANTFGYVGGLNLQVQSLDSIGIDIFNFGTSLTGLRIGIFGQ